MDHVIKRGEYADTGVPHYWIVDLDPTSCGFNSGERT
jgi:hypothetical protein